MKETSIKMKVATFGELMLRLAPEGYLKFVQADKLGMTFGGGEANVAVSLANFDINAQFISKLPNNDIGQCAINSLRKFGVATHKITRGGSRIGIYYLEKGASQRASKVIYDRAYSSIAEAKEEDFDWNELLKDVNWFHFSGITPALSDTLTKITETALQVCKKNGITVSCDLNYRKKLWSKEKANKVMSSLMKYVDICIANEEDASDVFDIKALYTDIESGIINCDGYKSVAKQLVERFNFKIVAITLRESLSASDNLWSAMLYQNSSFYFSKKYSIHIVDRVGGGDSFGAGLIYGFINKFTLQDTLDFAVAASCLKHTVEGDYNMVSKDEVLALVNGNGSGRVVR